MDMVYKVKSSKLTFDLCCLFFSFFYLKLRSFPIKKLLNNMEMKMNKVVTELKDKQLQFDQKIKEAEEIDKKLKIVSADIIC